MLPECALCGELNPSALIKRRRLCVRQLRGSRAREAGGALRAVRPYSAFGRAITSRAAAIRPGRPHYASIVIGLRTLRT